MHVTISLTRKIAPLSVGSLVQVVEGGATPVVAPAVQLPLFFATSLRLLSYSRGVSPTILLSPHNTGVASSKVLFDKIYHLFLLFYCSQKLF
jgi:hypothetical protein